MSQVIVHGKKKHGLGYLPDIPDIRDFTISDIKNSLPKGLLKSFRRKVDPELPKLASVKQYDSPVNDQGETGVCTADALSSLLENLQKRAFGKYTDASRLFTYWVTRWMMGPEYVNVDSGAYNRTAIKSVLKCGLLSEETWPYDQSTFARPPTIDMFMNTEPYRALDYARVDTTYGDECVNRMKKFIASGFPLYTGFVVYDNIWDITKSDDVLKYPKRNKDKAIGGHAVMVSGYDDEVETNIGSGVFEIKNSWGEGFGNGGYFKMPYEYFKNGIALDTWNITSLQLVESKQFD